MVLYMLYIVIQFTIFTVKLSVCQFYLRRFIDEQPISLQWKQDNFQV